MENLNTFTLLAATSTATAIKMEHTVTSTCHNLTMYVYFLPRFPFPLYIFIVNSLNVELYPIRHLLALVGARHIVHVSRVRIN